MSIFKNMSAQWGVTAKLTTLFVLFGFVPMAIIGLIAYNASRTIEGSAGTRFQNVAEGIADKIDRNLFERYGDVQAFGINRVIDQKAAWYHTEEQHNPLIEVMNQYVDTYDLYYLTILVDLEGRVIAVNSKDADGKPIQSQALYRNNYRETAWFRALKSQEFTTTMPFAASGNTTMTGTYIEDLHTDRDVKIAYPGDDGLTLGFSAPVYREGKVVAYWTNRAKFSLVEDILRTTQQELKAAGFPRASVVLLNKDGKILADYDPAEAGTELIRHDFTTLMTTNLVDRGMPAATGAVAGKTGFANGPHYRNGILRMTGYTHLKGALGYPGMNWSVLVSVNHVGATADAQSINRNVLIAVLICLVIILPLGITIGRIGVRGIGKVSEAAVKLAGGALDTRISVTARDEIGILAQSFNEMGAQLQAKMTKEREQAANMGLFMVDAKRVLGSLAQGDLTSQMTNAYEGDLDQLKVSLNSAMSNLTTTFTTVRAAAESVMTGSGQITKGNEDLSQRTAEQASSLEETSSAMEEMTSTVKQNADNAKQANQLAIAARDVANKGGAVTTKAVEAMGEINKSSKKIADIITVIDEIAFQTNLLALNAAVEAARAGEHGRGFAVVAAEVRNLAQRSATAAKEIKGLINESIQRVTDGSELVDQCGKTLEEIVGSVKRVTDIIAEISAASQEQASGIDQVNKAIMQMDETTQQNAALVEETTSASQSMKEQARELMRQVEMFKTNNTNDVSYVKLGAPDSGTKYAARTTSKPMNKKPLGSTKRADDKASVDVAAGNGKDRRSKEAEFEEF